MSSRRCLWLAAASFAAFALLASPALARPKKKKRRAAPTAAAVDANSPSPYGPYPGARRNSKETERYMEQADVVQADVFDVAASYPRVVKYYKARAAADATFESESDNLYLVGRDPWQVRVEKLSSRSARIIISKKPAAAVSEGTTSRRGRRAGGGGQPQPGDANFNPLTQSVNGPEPQDGDNSPPPPSPSGGGDGEKRGAPGIGTSGAFGGGETGPGSSGPMGPGPGGH